MLCYNGVMTVNLPSKADTTPRTKVLKNGAIYDLDKKRITGGAVLTSVKAAELVANKITNKRAAIAQAANEAVESGSIRTSYGDMAFVAEITKVMMMRATTPEDSKGVDAAKWLIQEAGIGERQQEQAQQQVVTHTIDPDVMALLAQIAEQQQNGFDNYTYRNHDSVIDVPVIDADSSTLAADSTAADDTAQQAGTAQADDTG
jgi:hypothetical protein